MRGMGHAQYALADDVVLGVVLVGRVVGRIEGAKVEMGRYCRRTHCTRPSCRVRASHGVASRGGKHARRPAGIPVEAALDSLGSEIFFHFAGLTLACGPWTPAPFICKYLKSVSGSVDERRRSGVLVDRFPLTTSEDSSTTLWSITADRIGMHSIS